MFADRTSWPRDENPLSKALQSKRLQNQKILDLTQSNPTLCRFLYSQSPLFETLSHPENTRYTPDPHGLSVAREAVARYYAGKNIHVPLENIFLTSGTSEAYSFLFRLLANPGDTVLAPAPGYPLFDFLTGLNDLKLEKYPLAYGNAWRLDESRLSAFSEKNPRALIWVNPNNPTGNYATPEEMKALNHFGVKNSCALIADEVFLDYSSRKGEWRSFAGNEEALTFTLSGISKILGLPQMKLSWIIVSGPKDLRDEALHRLEVIADTYLSVNAPVQNALPFWLPEAPKVCGEILERVNGNREALLQALQNRRDVEVLNAEGGWYATLRMKGIRDEDYCLRLLRENNVFVHPGYFFDFETEDFLVVSLLAPSEEFKTAIQALGRIDG